MVREVEISNQFELLNDDADYSEELGTDIFSGTLANDGKDLTINISKEMPPSGVRKLLLYHGDVDFMTQSVKYNHIESVEVIDTNYTFDISSILSTPRRIADTADSVQALVQFYTYEANISTDYGTKKVTVPYSTSAMLPNRESTDGILKLYLIDFNDWYFDISYMIGDVVVQGGLLYTSMSDYNISHSPDATPENWELTTDEYLTEYAYGATETQPLNSIISDVLISREAKYSYILPKLQKSSFNPVDDAAMHKSAMLLTMLRDNATLLLLEHKPVGAAYALEQLYAAADMQPALTAFTL